MKKEENTLPRIVWLTDLLCLCFSYYIVLNIRFAGPLQWYSKTVYTCILILFLFSFFLVTTFKKKERSITSQGLLAKFASVTKIATLTLILTLTFIFLLGWGQKLSRLFIISFFGTDLVLTYIAHVMIGDIAKQLESEKSNCIKVLVVTLPNLIDETITELKKDLGTRYQIIGAVSIKDVRGMTPNEEFAAITKIMTQIPFDEVYIDTPGIQTEELLPLIERFKEMGVCCRCNLTLPTINGKFPTIELYGDHTTAVYTETVYPKGQLILKRMMDIAGGIVGSLLTLILCIFLVPAIKLDSPGPVFFSQIRIGKNGRRFKIYKFRSMCVDAEQKLDELKKDNEVDGLMFKLEKDPRITRVGAFLRKTSLDEFPQFFNILLGDMSLVGTRPPTENEFAEYNEHYRRRLSMTPGLTGMWQVSGRSEIKNFDEVVKLDLQYIDNWSLLLDTKILLKTILVVIYRTGAK